MTPAAAPAIASSSTRKPDLRLLGAPLQSTTVPPPGPPLAIDWRSLLDAVRLLVDVPACILVRRTAEGQEVLHAQHLTPEECARLLGQPRRSGNGSPADAAGPAFTQRPGPNGGHIVEIAVPQDSETSHAILLVRPAGHPPFRDLEIAAIRRLAPLLANILRGAAAAEADGALCRATLAVLRQFAVGLCLVDEAMRAVLVCDRAAASGAFTIRRGRLGSPWPADEPRLRAAVAESLGGPGRPAVGLCLGPVAQPVRVLVTAVDAPRPGRASGRLAAIIIPCGAPPDHQEQLIRTMFGLTRVEAAITKLLSDGVPPNDAADRMRMRPNTLRGYMKGIFAKLAVHRQSDLVRVVNSTAGLLRSPTPAEAIRHRSAS